jgi:heme/copper-type cytochrome/quinol oxidase subunit 3
MIRRSLDVSALPSIAFGPRAPLWWGVVGLIAIEGTALAMIGASYLYVRRNVVEWPPAGTSLPALGAATVELAVLLLSLLPMILVDRASRREEYLPVMLGLGVVTAFGLASLCLRAYQLASALDTRWDADVYGSVVWFLLGMHAVHVITSTVENALILAVLLLGPVECKDYVDAHVNALFWYFVVATWIAVYALVYVAPRWL